MSRIKKLREIEATLESFLDRAVEQKEERLDVIEGINWLDDIALGMHSGADLSEEVGDWFASHNTWLSESRMRPADRKRIGEILGEISADLSQNDDTSAAMEKIASEIKRWTGGVKAGSDKLVLRRGPEEASKSVKRNDSTIGAFSAEFDTLNNLFITLSEGKAHILSVLDEALTKAYLQKDKQALILSGLVIYYLKQNSYKVEPYVRRLKEAERRQKEMG